jgi:hypothetical protein
VSSTPPFLATFCTAAEAFRYSAASKCIRTTVDGTIVQDPPLLVSGALSFIDPKVPPTDPQFAPRFPLHPLHFPREHGENACASSRNDANVHTFPLACMLFWRITHVGSRVVVAGNAARDGHKWCMALADTEMLVAWWWTGGQIAILFMGFATWHCSSLGQIGGAHLPHLPNTHQRKQARVGLGQTPMTCTTAMLTVTVVAAFGLSVRGARRGAGWTESPETTTPSLTTVWFGSSSLPCDDAAVFQWCSWCKVTSRNGVNQSYCFRISFSFSCFFFFTAGIFRFKWLRQRCTPPHAHASRNPTLAMVALLCDPLVDMGHKFDGSARNGLQHSK